MGVSKQPLTALVAHRSLAVRLSNNQVESVFQRPIWLLVTGLSIRQM